MTEVRANQWTGFYMIAASIMKELTYFMLLVSLDNIRKHQGDTEIDQ